MDILKFLKIAEDMEVKMHDLYYAFSQRFASDEEAALTFRKMANDEEQHRQIVALEIKLVTGERKNFSDVDLDISGIPQLLAKVDEILKSTPGPSLAEALKFSIAFEKSVAEIHFRKAISVSNPKMASFMKMLSGYDEVHAAFLEAFAKKRGFAV